jgi:hypothetical protein
MRNTNNWLWTEQLRIQGLIPCNGKRLRDFSLLNSVQASSEAHTASYSLCTGDSPPGVKQQPGSKGTHSPPSSANVKNLYSYTPTPPYAFTVCSMILPFLGTFTCNKQLLALSCLSVHIYQVNPIRQAFRKYHTQDFYYSLKTYS